jgi:hypothetical protein
MAAATATVSILIEVLEENRMRRIILRIGALLLAICRTVYCWFFFVLSAFMFHTVYTNISRMVRLHSAEGVEIITWMIMAIYSTVWGIAWWMIIRGKQALKRWAIAASLILILFYLPAYLPAVVSGNWRGVLKDELSWWPVIVIGIFGIIIFSIPYRGWRQRSAGDLGLNRGAHDSI